jgi:ABC-2 type transport system ATP-binding protein
LAEPALQPLIELHDVSRWYGALQALRGVTFRLAPGRIGLLGPNGAGKSTLLKILLGLLSPSSGTVRVLGRDVREGAALRRMVGYMPEADGLVPGLAGVEYVALAGELYGMPRREARRRAHEVLTYLELDEARYRRLEEYSTGMKQRLKLAQALVHDPPILLLDEPTSGLDPAGRDAMLDLLEALGREHRKSLVLCTHLLGDVERVCETVLILHEGRLLRQGTVSELCAHRQDRYRLGVQGDAGAFLHELLLEGVRLVEDNGRGRLRVAVPPSWTTRAFFVLANNHGVTLQGLERDDESLEELFHRVLNEASQGRPRPDQQDTQRPEPVSWTGEGDTVPVSWTGENGNGELTHGGSL